MVKFTYIHVPGCDCASPSYSERLAAARAEAAPLLGYGHTPADVVPDGSCLGWVNDWVRQGGGRPPCDHRDYSLLALHRAAIEERAAHPPHSTGARDALAEALDDAPWGAQPDGSFVTRRRASWSESGDYITLHAPAKGGPLAEVAHGRLRELRTPSAARAIREQERASRRARAAVYEETAARAAAEVEAGTILLHRCGAPHLPGSWEAYDGQEGGYLVSPDGVTVSLPGVLRRAGVSVADDEVPLDVLLQHLLDCTRERAARVRMPRTGKFLGRRRREAVSRHSEVA